MKLIDKLPKSYDELSYKTYLTILKSLPESQPEMMDDEEWGSYVRFFILSSLLDVPIIDLETLPINDLLPLMKHIEYFNHLPEPSKTGIQIKSINELTYDEFVNYTKLRINQNEHTSKLLSIVVIGKSRDEIENMSVSEVYECFFMLTSYTNRYLRHSQISLAQTLVKQIIQMIWRKIKNLFQKDQSLLVS